MFKTFLTSMVAGAAIAGGDKLHFVYELTRHGARAPTSAGDGYTVEAGMLTPQGMRQRYLLGQYNGKRYMEEYDFIDLEEGNEQVLMMSTLVNRTMQSGYSELMGMFKPDPKKAVKLTHGQQEAIQRDGAASPPFQVREQLGVNQDLGDSPLPEGFVQIPIYNHMETSMADDLDLPGCDYVQAVDGYRFPAESTYSGVEYLKDDLRIPIAENFDLTEDETVNMSFMDLYGKCDVVQSDLFEGIANYNFTLEQMNQINETVLATLVLPLADPVLSRNMYISKQLRLPLTMSTRFVDSVVQGTNKPPKVKFLSYSTHDWTVSQMLLFLDADNGHFDNVPFASSVVMELHSSDECQSEECFWVEVIYNGEHLEFGAECENAKYCSYPEFMQMIEFKGFVNTRTHYEHECAKTWSPTSNSMQNFLYRRYTSGAYNIYKT